MKQWKLISVILLAVISLFVLLKGSFQQGNKIQANPPSEIERHKYTLSTPPSKGEIALVSANSNFAFALFSQLRSSNHGNLVLSPYGVSTVMSMIRNGATGQTRQEIDRITYLTELPLEEVNTGNQSLMQRQVNNDPGSMVAIANALWMDDSFAARANKQLLNSLETQYQAAAKVESFKDPSTLAHINAWASEKTKGNIPQILEKLGPRDVLALLNAVYFNCKWKEPFKKENTLPTTFYLSSGQEITTPMMNQSGTFSHFGNDEFQVLELPYKNLQYSMYLFLPEKKISFDQFLQSLNKSSWDKMLASLKMEEGQVSLPRFKFDSKHDLKSILMAMGIQQAFTEKSAEFPMLTTINDPNYHLYLSQALQRAKIDLDEEGTTAAAVTVVVVGAEEGAMTLAAPPFRFIADHPFFFAIAHKQTKSILFMGVVEDPSK